MTRLTRSTRLTAVLSTCVVAIAGGLAAPAGAGGPDVAASRDATLVAMSADQQRACEAERQALQQQLNQCGADQQCRQRLQAAIASLNARCRG